MAKKRRTGRQAEIENLSMALAMNGSAQLENHHRKKTWNHHDLTPIRPLTCTQEELFHGWYNNEHICAYGSAGTGKTFLSLYLALNEIFNKSQQKIIIVRSAVPTRDVGFLPGTLEEKTMQYELPYHDILHELVGRVSTYSDMKEAGIIEFVTTSFVRGLTWDNAIIIIDEFQNMTLSEIDSVITRVGENSRVIMCGDVSHQCDLRKEKTGASDVINIIDRIKSFSTIHFSKDDIVRSKLVKSWIVARDDLKL